MNRRPDRTGGVGIVAGNIPVSYDQAIFMVDVRCHAALPVTGLRPFTIGFQHTNGLSQTLCQERIPVQAAEPLNQQAGDFEHGVLINQPGAHRRL